MPRHLFTLLINVVTQYLCVRGVNRLTAFSTALTIAIVLSVRKFISLALSVIIFGNTLGTGAKIGAVLVAIGAAWYAFESKSRTRRRYHPITLSIVPSLGRFSNLLRLVFRMPGYCRTRWSKWKRQYYRDYSGDGFRP